MIRGQNAITPGFDNHATLLRAGQGASELGTRTNSPGPYGNEIGFDYMGVI